jgi:hypothetical protein
MEAQASLRPVSLRHWERWALVVLIGLCLTLSLLGKGRRQREAYENFLARAPVVQAALERFAADHGGKFPPDGVHTGRPPGFSDKYLAWDRHWNIDYDVYDNGHGGKYVCLEFCGPFKDPVYFALCRNPENRRLYGRGQPIPGQMNRIWLIREQAPILDAPRFLGKGD